VTVRYLVDANILFEQLKPRPDPSVVRRLALHHGAIATASPVWHELLLGGLRSPSPPKRDAVLEFLGAIAAAGLEVLPYDRAAAEWHSTERARLMDRGRVPPFVDGQIAAIAAVNRLTLVTRNTRDFRPFSGLSVVSWFSR
jgi:tRNA(fMet)-specific endonuclease VapC